MPEPSLSQCRSLTPELLSLYRASFPPEERRDEQSLALNVASGRITLLHITIPQPNGPALFAGFMTLWELTCGIAYVEHFAVEPSMRNSGIGAQALRLLAASLPGGIVLEVEPPCAGETARRRIGFYERCGFTFHPRFHYIQPSYSPGLPEVELRLMTLRKPPSLSLARISSSLHREVYSRIPCASC